MSLLMDALKRAESSKQQALRGPLAARAANATDGLTLEPIAADAGNIQSNPLPDLAEHQAAVDADLARSAEPLTAPSRPPGNNVGTEQAHRNAVRNAFAAKQSVETPSRLPLWLALGTLLIAAIAIGGYVWFQLNTMNNSSLAVTAPLPAAMPAAAPSVPAPPTAPAASAASLDFSPNSGLTVANASSDNKPLFTPRQEAASPQSQPGIDEPMRGPPIRLTRSAPMPDTLQLRAQASLLRGELDLARLEYEQALKRDPNNTDVLLALAAIAQRQNHPGDAEALRQRAWIANPSDPAAQSAILSGAAAGADPQGAESRLKSLLSAQPESAPLNFALGNLMSRQNRWPEAQEAYFNAVASDGDNPDFLFNLAVSLDHLRQPRLAAQHYRLALEAAARRAAAFDRPNVEKRLLELGADSAR